MQTFCEDRSIRVESSPAKATNFIAKNRLGERCTAPKEPIIVAEYEVKGSEEYVRIEVENHKGGTAWTNPIILNQESTGFSVKNES